MTKRLRATSAVLGCLAVAGCGSSAHHSARASGEASKPAAQILADAAAALRGARGYVMQGQIYQLGQLERVHVVASTGSLDVAITGDAGRAELILVPAGVFVRGDATFWASHGEPRAQVLAGHWIQIPPASAETTTASLAQFAPATAARCLVENHGTLSVVGKTSVAGQPAVVIRDAGNVPGDSAGTLAVATSGNPYPLRVVNTGPHRAGGRIDVCNDGRPDNGHGVLTFSQFDQAPPIKAPINPVQMGPQGGVA